MLGGSVGGAGGISDQRGLRRPGNGAGDVERQESPVGKAAHAGQPSDEHAQGGGEPADEHRSAAAAAQQCLAALDVLGFDQPAGQPREQPVTVVPADLVADRVAKDRARCAECDDHGRETRCSWASTPPSRMAISPGKMNPANNDASSAGSRNTTNSATGAGTVSSRSISQPIQHTPAVRHRGQPHAAPGGASASTAAHLHVA